MRGAVIWLHHKAMWTVTWGDGLKVGGLRFVGERRGGRGAMFHFESTFFEVEWDEGETISWSLILYGRGVPKTLSSTRGL